MYNREFETELYDKKDLFLFFIVKMPYIDNIMHTIIFHAEVWSEILHLTITTSSKEKFQKLITTVVFYYYFRLNDFLFIFYITYFF